MGMKTTQTSSNALDAGFRSHKFTVTEGNRMWFVKVTAGRRTNYVSLRTIIREGGNRSTPGNSKIAARIMAAIRSDIESTWNALAACGC